MVTVTSIGGRAVVLAASAVVHVAIAAAAVTGGHGVEGATAARATPSEIAVEMLAPVPAIDEPATPITPTTQAGRAASSHAHTHRHPYAVPIDHDAHPHDPSLVHTALGMHAHDDDAPHDAPHDAPAVATAAASDVPRFTIAAGASNVSFGAVASERSDAHGDGDGPAPIVEATSLAEPAKRVAWREPEYPEAARAAGIEAEIPVEIVIDAHGAVESARATRHVGYGLDEAATRAVRTWRFSPRTASGKPVRVRLVCPVVFKLTN